MKQREAIEVKQRPAAVPPGSITLAEIDAVKRSFIERNLSLSPDEVGAIFGKSGRWALSKVRDGVLVAIDGEVRRGEDGSLQASRYVRITAESVEAYRRSIVIDPDRWGE